VVALTWDWYSADACGFPEQTAKPVGKDVADARQMDNVERVALEEGQPIVERVVEPTLHIDQRAVVGQQREVTPIQVMVESFQPQHNR
jgi:hypothetical protein